MISFLVKGTTSKDADCNKADTASGKTERKEGEPLEMSLDDSL